MTLIVVGVSNCRQKSFRIYKGKRFYYRLKCVKIFYYDESGFHTKYAKGLDVFLWRAKVQKLKTFVCKTCGFKYRSNKRKCLKCE